MGDRVSELERQLVELRATIRTSLWASGVIVAIVLAFFGYTTAVGIPAAAKKALEGNTASETIRQIEEQKKKGDELLGNIKKTAESVDALAVYINSGRLKFEKRCLRREDNNCDPWKALPSCSSGFLDAGITLDNYEHGGPCGTGSVCRLCYSFGKT